MKKFLCIALSLMFLMGMLTSCKTDKTEGEGQTTEAETVTEAPMDAISDYAVVRSASGDQYLGKVAVQLKKALDAASGGAIELKDDHLTGDESTDNDNKEILVGKTNRPESIAVYEELGDDFKFIIRQVENKLVVAAPTTELLGKAVDYLSETYLKNTGDGSYPLAKDISYTSKNFEYLELVTEKKLNYQIVYPSEIGTVSVNKMTAVRDALKSVSTTTPTVIPDTSSQATTVKAIVLGPVNLPGVSDVIRGLPYLGYQVIQKGSQVYYTCRDEATLWALCEQFLESIPRGKCANGSVRLLIPGTKPVCVWDWAETIPEFPSEGGTFHSIDEFSDNLYRIYYTNTTLAQYNSYTATLEGNGFVLYAENKIGNHVYRTYRGEECMIHAYYTDTTKEIRLLVGDVDAAVEYDLSAVSDGQVTDPVFTFMAPDYDAQATKGENGMGMIFTMKDGSFVIVDGGWGYDTKGLYDYLVANNKRSDGILIRAWLITHPHEDHYGNVVKFANTYASKVKVEKFVANFAEGTYARDGSAADDIAIIMPALAKFDGAEFLVPQVGQKMYFGEMKMEFLYTVECAYPAKNIGDSNNHSLCAKIDFYGKDILMTGDSYGVACNYLVNTFGSYIQSEYLQVPHHNGNGGSKNFYSLVKPKVILVSTTQEKYDRTIVDSDQPLYYLVKTMNTVKTIYVGDNGYKKIQ